LGYADAMLFFLAAIAPVPPAIPAILKSDLRCVAVLAVNADPKLKRDGAYYSAIVGADIMDATKETRESVREAMLEEAAAVRKSGKPRADTVAACIRQMRARIALAK
jgi:hypothetical protein